MSDLTPVSNRKLGLARRIGWLPAGARFTLEREDQGQDLVTKWRGRIISPSFGRVIEIGHDRPFPDGFGPDYAIVRILRGKWKGEWYVGHCTAKLGVGARLWPFRTIALADQGHRLGGGWVEIGRWINGRPAPMGDGAKIHHLFV